MQKGNKVVRILGNLLMCIALIYTIKKLISYEVDLSIIKEPISIIIILISVCIYIINVILGCWPWRAVVSEVAKEKVPFMEIALIYTKANIYKYVPGNVFQYVGRNELATKRDLKHSDVALSTIIDTIWNLFSIGAVSVILYWDGFILWINYQEISKEYIIIAIFILCIFILVAAIIIKKFHIQAVKLQEKLKKLFKKSFYICLIKNFVFYAIQCIINSIITFSIFMIISSEDFSFFSFKLCLGAILVSWIIGFITPGAPGGLGVRETVLIFLLKGELAEEVILLGVVINRVISIIGDLGAFAGTRVIDRIMLASKNRGH